MSTPYHFTPRMPKAPHPTPSSITKVNISATRPSRPPIKNPYEKFTQPEFDAWIDNITGALKRALGEEPEPRAQETEVDPSYNPYSRFLPPEAESGEEGIDDSFAEIKARRAANKKGKARDPREGPGLGGKGAQDEPIEIASSDEDDAEEAKEVEMSIALLEDSESEEEDNQTGERDYSWERSSPPMQLTKRNERYDDEEGSEEYEEYSEEEFDQELQEKSQYSDDDKENEQPHATSGDVLPKDFIRRPREEEVYILDDDDIEEIVYDGEEQEPEEEDAEGEDEDEEFEEEYEEEYEEDYEEGAEDDEEDGEDKIGATSEVIEIEDDEEIENIQPMENDTSFPPLPSLPLNEVKRHVEIRDPWSGPRSYAQDFYSGGDRIPSGRQVDPHHLGPTDSDIIATEDGLVNDMNTVQPISEDTSFPPAQEHHEPPVDIQDPWSGPQTFAEDYYSGGDFRSIHGGVPNPHYISNNDSDYIEELIKGDKHLVNQFDISQPLDEDTGFSVHVEQLELPVELPDQWAGPATYAEDYYAGGDIRASPDIPIDPSLLSGTAGTGDLEDDIDSFLTPDNASGYASNERTPMSYIEEEEDDEVIQPPAIQQPTGVSKFMRGQPIPADAEIIAIDSDEEGDYFVQERVEENVVDDVVDVDEDLEVGYPKFDELPQGDEEMHDDLEEIDELASDTGDIIVPPTASLFPEEVPPQPMSEVIEEHVINDEDLSVADVEDTEMQDSQIENQQVGYTVHSPSPLPGSVAVRESSLLIDMNSRSPEDIHTQSQSLVLPSEVVEPDTVLESSEGGVTAQISIEFEETREVPSEAPAQGAIEERSINGTPGEQVHEAIMEPTVPQAATTEVVAKSDTTLIDIGVPALAETDTNDGNSIPEAEENILQSVSVTDAIKVDGDSRSSPIREDDGGKNEPTIETTSVAISPEDVLFHDMIVTLSTEIFDGSQDEAVEHQEIIEHQESLHPQDDTKGPENEMDDDHAKSVLYDVSEFPDEPNSADNIGVDEEQDSPNLEVVSIASDTDNVTMGGDSFVVEEEVQTEGRLTVEPPERQMSLRVDSIGPEEVVKPHESAKLASDTVEEDTSMQLPPIDQDMVPLDKSNEHEETVPAIEPASTGGDEIVDTGMDDTASILHGLPMPVVANARIADPVDRPLTPLFEEQEPVLQVAVSEDLTPDINVVSSSQSVPDDGLVHDENISQTAMQQENVGQVAISQDIQKEQEEAPTPMTDIPFEPVTTRPNSLAPILQSNLPPTMAENTPNNGISTHSPSSMGVALTRNPTVPVLASDPYPYSLSTPGTSLYSAVDEASEDDAALNNSMSSNSTVEKEENEVVLSNILDEQLLYVPSQETHSQETEEEKGQSPFSIPPSHVADVFTTTPTSNHPESLKPENKNEPTPEPGPSKQPSKRKRESPANKTKKLDSVPRPRGRPRKHPKPEPKGIISEVENPEPTDEETILYKPVKGKSVAKADRAHSEVSQGSQASSGATLALKTLKPVSRASSVASSVPSDKSFTGQSSPTVARPGAVYIPDLLPPTSLLHAHGAKRKAQAQRVSQAIAQLHRQAPSRTPPLPKISEHTSTNVTAPIHATSSAEGNLPGTPVNGPVISDIPTSTEGSTYVEKPPVVTSSGSFTSAPEPATPTSVAPTPPVQVATSPSIAALKASATKPTANPSRHGVMSSSPVTRSHCRYHRISLPKEEGGPRICFLVPGCSLNDKTLMEEEEIEDHGDATHEDSLKMVKDIETLGFDLDLIGVLRQLVGLDILREQEVFYLPLPGEEITRKHVIRKTASEKTAIIRAAGETSNQGSSPTYLASPTHNRPPPSVADSTSTTFSNLRNLVDHDTNATQLMTEDETSEDDDEPSAKRTRPSPPEETSVMGPPANQSKGKQKLKAKRIDTTYQPEENEEESDADLSPKKRRITTATRGVKRSRTSDAIAHGDSNDRQSKKLRAHTTAPQISSPQKSDSLETSSQQPILTQEASHQNGQTQSISQQQQPEQNLQTPQPLEPIPELPPSTS